MTLRKNESREQPRSDAVPGQRAHDLSWIAQAIAAVNESNAQLRHFSAGLADMQKQIRDGADEFLRAVTPMVATMRHISSNIAEWHQVQPDGARLLGPHGWVLPLHLALNGGARHIVELAEREGIAAAEAAIVAAVDADSRRRIVRDCLTVPVFGKWRQHLVAALRAHERGEYVLSIPVWLLVFEGVAYARLKTTLRKGYVFTQMSKKRRAALLAELGVGDSWSAYTEALVEAIAAMGSPQAAQGSGGGPTTRHAILHGRVPGYGTEARSLQLLLLLEALSLGAQDRERSN